jgi:hypothetical protein
VTQRTHSTKKGRALARPFLGSFHQARRARGQALGLGNVACRAGYSWNSWSCRGGWSGWGGGSSCCRGNTGCRSGRSHAGWSWRNGRARGDDARIEGGATVGAWSAAHDHGAGNTAFADDRTAVDGRARATASGGNRSCFASAARCRSGCAARCWCRRAASCLASMQLGQQSTAAAFLLGVQSSEQAGAATAARATVTTSGRQRPEARNDKGHSGQCNHSQTNHSKHPPERTRNTDPRKTQIHAKHRGAHPENGWKSWIEDKAGVARPSLGTRCPGSPRALAKRTKWGLCAV